jgi:hypothetical protein
VYTVLVLLVRQNSLLFPALPKRTYSLFGIATRLRITICNENAYEIVFLLFVTVLRWFLHILFTFVAYTLNR